MSENKKKKSAGRGGKGTFLFSRHFCGKKSSQLLEIAASSRRLSLGSRFLKQRSH